MNNINYDKIQNQIIKDLKGDAKLLIHSCCAPCSSYCLEKISPYFKTDVFYYNPNITSSEEYLKRLEEQINFVKRVYGDTIRVINGEYNPSDFYTAVKGLENQVEGGKRCRICYQLRLEETAKKAKELSADMFGTTLTVSPHKNAGVINQIGVELEKKYKISFLVADFKKRDGYKRSIVLSKENDIYRQNYCGCKYSIWFDSKE